MDLTTKIQQTPEEINYPEWDSVIIAQLVGASSQYSKVASSIPVLGKGTYKNELKENIGSIMLGQNTIKIT